jgi:histidinol-phosphate aminotransferase
VEIRERFAARLRERGFDPIPSAANFILVPIAHAATVASVMRERGIAVRPYPALRGIGDAVRITMAPWATMERVLDALVAARGTVQQEHVMHTPESGR